MSGSKLNMAKEAIVGVIDNLAAGDRLHVVQVVFGVGFVDKRSTMTEQILFSKMATAFKSQNLWKK
jgi:hypothetical protein